MPRSPRDVYLVNTGCCDYLDGYGGKISMVLGMVLVIFGLLSISLGIGAVCTLASGFYIGYGIWCGILFCFTGFMCVFAGYKKSICMVVGTCICCVLTLCIAIAQISIGITAAVDDSESVRENIQAQRVDKGYLAYDIYYERNNPYKYLCSGPNRPFTWKFSWGPIDVLLILSGFVVFFTALAASIITCYHSNVGTRIILGNKLFTNEDQEAFGNESYITAMRSSEPALINA